MSCFMFRTYVSCSVPMSLVPVSLYRIKSLIYQFNGRADIPEDRRCKAEAWMLYYMFSFANTKKKKKKKTEMAFTLNQP